MKKFKVFLYLFLLIFLISCGSAKIDTETTIEKTNISNMKIILTYDSLVKNNLGSTIIKDNINSNLTVKSSYNNETKMYTEELILSKEDIDSLLLNSKLKEFLLIEKYKINSLFTDLYTFNIKFLSNFSSALDNNLSQHLKDIPFTNKVIIPGKLISSNANKVIDEETLEWSYTLDQINTDTNIEFKYEMLNPFRIILFTLIVVAVLSYAIFIINKRKVNNN